MKIVTYKVPIELTRDSTGHVNLALNDEKREKIKVTELGEDTRDIISISKQLSDHNEKQKTIAKMIMGAEESTKSAFVEFQYLE